MRHIGLTTAALLLLAQAPARAQEGAEATARKHVNLRANPLGLIVGVVDAEVDVRWSDHVAVAPMISYYRLSALDIRQTGVGFGLRATISPKGRVLADGFIVSPFAIAVFTTVTAGATEAQARGVGVGSLVGYQWMWDGGFNINLGGGLAYYALSSSADNGKGDSLAIALAGIGPALEFTLGYAF